MLKSILICDPQEIISDEWLKISSGTDTEVNEINHFKAFFPKQDWKNLTKDERLILVTNKRVSLSQAVTVISCGRELVEYAHNVVLPTVVEQSKGNETLSSERARKLNTLSDMLVSSLRNLGIETTQRGPSDFVINPPGRISTAFNYDSKTLMGLHLDNHQNYSLLEREKSFHLVCINLGYTKRFLNFVNLNVLDLLRETNLLEKCKELTTVTLKEAFFQKFPSYPVVQVGLEPGSAYLCNTQDIIHDGTTNSDGFPDVSFLMSGIFDWIQ